ncbi:GNAT family N-acetyltransferase [Olleya aquimaris]|uniref:Acetyltransferase (GNAT) family protein n=1 Tax=Olleya aquimaris TaxID=639310 RepID=A0A327RJM4_9FLAO|nr:GNAT family N-acetyltransferase [Olleya aquimaris]RAJ17139.1 acetyltransferase (GNAT) family protein [Olleya aquimaris]
MSNCVSLKVIQLSDHDTLLALMQRIYPPAYKYLWQNEDCTWYLHSQYGYNNFKQELQQPNSDYFFIQQANKHIGILRLVHNTETKSTKLHRLYLDQDYQGQGLGKKMMTITKEISKKNQSNTLWLEAMQNQQQALQFYLKQGFSIQNTYQLPFDLIHEHLRGIHKMSKQI